MPVKPPLDPGVADLAPSTYLRLLDADAQGADRREEARIVLPLRLRQFDA
jgi:hypothetical protein